jgi:hypothetical protein
MKKLKVLPLALAAFACASAGATDLDYSMKLRGIAGSATKDGVRNGLGFGFNVGIGLTKDSKVDVELGYRYLTGDGRNVDFPSNALGSTLADQNQPISAQPGASTNFQKTNVQGFTLRGIYNHAFLMPNLSWRAGLSVNFMKSRMDAIGDFRAAAPSQTAAGSWAFNPQQTGTTASPIVGLGYDFSESGAIELNLIMDSYKQVTVDPAFNPAAVPANTRVTPSIGSKNINTLKLEFGYTFRF